MSYQEAGNALLDKYGNQAEKKRKKEQKGETIQGKSRSFKED